MKIKDVEIHGETHSLNQYFVIKDEYQDAYVSYISWRGNEFTNKINQAECFEDYETALNEAIRGEVKTFTIHKFYKLEEEE